MFNNSYPRVTVLDHHRIQCNGICRQVRFTRSPYSGRLSETFLGAPCLHKYGARHVGTQTNASAEEILCLLKGEKKIIIIKDNNKKIYPASI